LFVGSKDWSVAQGLSSNLRLGKTNCKRDLEVALSPPAGVETYLDNRQMIGKNGKEREISDMKMSEKETM
jgi:hypothetical protein